TRAARRRNDTRRSACVPVSTATPAAAPASGTPDGSSSPKAPWRPEIPPTERFSMSVAQSRGNLPSPGRRAWSATTRAARAPARPRWFCAMGEAQRMRAHFVSRQPGAQHLSPAGAVDTGIGTESQERGMTGLHGTPPRILARTWARLSSRQRGFTLLEVLVSVLVLSIGLLGIAGLQLWSLRYNTSAYQSSQAGAV